MRPAPKWTIYCHTHVESGRRYIGLTKKTMMQRWNRHVYDALNHRSGNTHFANAIRKYGKDAFSHEVLEVCHSLEVANLAEECWIEFYDTRNPEKGFNLKKGGDHTPHPVKNPWDRPEFREKASRNLQKLIAAGLSPETRAKSAAANRTPESRMKASERTQRQFADPTSRKAMSDKVKELHKDPVIHAEFQKGLLTANVNRASKTHCKNGHEFSPEGTKTDKNGWRYCKQCSSDRTTRKQFEARTHCPRGHEYSPVNTARTSVGRRVCLTCKTFRFCKRGHDLSLPESRYPGTRGCRICKLALGQVLDAKRRKIRERRISLPL